MMTLTNVLQILTDLSKYKTTSKHYEKIKRLMLQEATTYNLVQAQKLLQKCKESND